MLKFSSKAKLAFTRKNGKVDYLAVVFVISIVIFVGWRIYILDKASSGLDLKKISENKETYFDNILNYTVSFPKGWEFDVAEPETIDEVAKKSSNGVTFNLMQHKLQSEVVPVVMLGQKGKEGYKVFASLALRGTDKTTNNIGDLLKTQTDNFVKLLTEMGHKDVQIITSDVIKAGPYSALYVKLKGTSSDKDVYYTECSQVIGTNLAIVTFGSLIDDVESQSTCLEILNSIKPITN